MLDLISRGGGDAVLEIMRMIIAFFFVIKIIMVFLKKSSIETCLTMQTFTEIAFDLIIIFLQVYSIMLARFQSQYIESDVTILRDPSIVNTYQ